MSTFTEIKIETDPSLIVYKFNDTGKIYRKEIIDDDDTLSGICLGYNLTDWEAVYNDPANAEFKKEFPDPDDISKEGLSPFYIPVPEMRDTVISFIGKGVENLIKTVTGPSEAEFGNRYRASEAGKDVIKIRKYTYKITEYKTSNLSNLEREALQKVEWGVIVPGEALAIRLGLFGDTIELDIISDYAERTIGVGPIIGGKIYGNRSIQTTIPFTVPLVPEIMKRTASGTGIFPIAVKTQEKWFDTVERNEILEGQSELSKPYDNSIITLAWVKSFTRGQAAYDRLIKKWFSDELMDQLKNNFVKHSLLAKSTLEQWGGFHGKTSYKRMPDPKVDMNIFNACYEQHEELGTSIFDPFDDLVASLANLDFRMTFEGEIGPVAADESQIVTITKAGLFIRDSFDFVGSQTGGLGDWKTHPPEITTGTLGDGFNDVDNAMYRDWRNNHDNIGHDYLVYSDVEYLTTNKSFRIYKNWRNVYDTEII